jgi:Rrf2 family iron-sulfur cluster assembly transcriptional regulator
MLITRRDRAMTAITLMLDVAFYAGRSGTVNSGDVADRTELARRGIEPLMQALSRAGLLESIRGPHGGYRLGRPQRDIRLSEIVAAALADDEAPSHRPGGRLQAAVVDGLWGELDEALQVKLEALTLDDLLRRAAAAGLRRPTLEPINFTI